MTTKVSRLVLKSIYMVYIHGTMVKPKTIGFQPLYQKLYMVIWVKIWYFMGKNDIQTST